LEPNRRLLFTTREPVRISGSFHWLVFESPVYQVHNGHKSEPLVNESGSHERDRNRYSTQPNTWTLTNTNIQTYWCTSVHIYTTLYIYTLIHMYVHTYTSIHIHTPIYIHIHYIHIHLNTHSNHNAHMQSTTHTHTCAHTNTHTHTHLMKIICVCNGLWVSGW